MTVNLTKIYTRLGDGGETHLGDMSRVAKTDPRIEAYGTRPSLIGIDTASPTQKFRTTSSAQRSRGESSGAGSRTSALASCITFTARRR